MQKSSLRASLGKVVRYPLWFFLVAFVGLYYAVCFLSFYSHSTLIETQRKRVVVFGDSLTQLGNDPNMTGWVASLAHHFGRKVDVFNRGYSGYNSKWGLSIIHESVIKLKPDLITLFWGANDAVFEMVIQHVPIGQYIRNLDEMIYALKTELPSVSIVLITPPPIDVVKLRTRNENLGKQITIDRSNERTFEYVTAVLDVGQRNKIPVLNCFIICEGESSNREDYLVDGLHLNRRGNMKLFEELIVIIAKSYPEFEKLQIDQPHWSKLDR